MNQPAPQFTAAQLARILGRQRQAVARTLADAPADGRVIVACVPVNAWSFAALPGTLQTEIEHCAQRMGFRSAQALLAAPPSANGWKPPVALADVSQCVLDGAVKLQRALAGMLARQHDASLTAAELEEIGRADYCREFGHSVTQRTIRSLFKRTMDRARCAGAQTFERLEFYLAEKPALKNPSKPAISLQAESEFRALHDAIAAFANPAAPSLAEKNYLWLCAFELYEEKLADGRAPKKVKRGLLKFLERNAPFLVSADCVSIANQLRVTFQRKFAKWEASERDAKALADAREFNSGNFRAPELNQVDRDRLIAHATLHCGGRVAQAWRELNERGEISETVAGYYLSNPASKSYVPARIAESVKYEVAMLEDIHHGPRAHKLNGAFIFRDWSKVAAGDWFQADDGTMPIYFYEPDGHGWFNLMRGQVLLFIDLRTTRILGFVLISERNYNAKAIRTLITKVADQYGLPRKGFYFEGGIWKAKILKGDVNAEAMSWGETEMGLREFGLRFVHARLPRAKPVEGIMAATQNLMEGLPGYVGRNEQIEVFERVKKQMQQVNARKLHPEGIFMDADTWAEKFTELCEQYNAARNDGKMTCGLSPNEAFEKFANRADPPVKFSPACRYLLAHHRRPVNVTGNGITLRFGSQVFNYRNAETGKLRGQRVFAWFNPELPEILTVTDTRRQNPFTVARTQEVPAMDAPAEIMAQEMGRIAEHQAYAKARYHVLKSTYAIPFRTMVADRDTVELGAEISEQRAALETVQVENSHMETKGRKAANRLGMAMSADKLRRPDVAANATRLAELLESDDTTTEKETQ